MTPDVRFGSKADMCSALGDVRFVPKADMRSFKNNELDFAGSVDKAPSRKNRTRSSHPEVV
jgi:hypothetical protein